MSDINSNIRIDFDTGSALAQLRSLQAGLSKFHQTLAQGNLAAANAQKGLTSSLLQSINATGKFVASQKTVSTSTAAFTTALEKNQLSLKEYFRYSAAAATANTKVLTKAFESEREILNRARRDRVKALQSQYIQLEKANGSLVKTLQVMPRSLQMANGQFTELGTRIQMAAQKQQFLNQLLKQGSTQLLNFGKNMQWAGRQLMVGLTIPLSMLAGYASKAFRELEKETLNFRRVYGDMFTSDAETEKAIQNIQAIANEYTKFGVAVKDTMGMAAKAAAAGFTGGALDAQVRQANKLAVLGQIEQQQALETTISLQNAFGISSEELAKKIDFLNAVENQTVLSIEDLTIAIPKAAPVVKQLGGSVEDLAFFLTAMKEGGVNASEGANALKSGLASLINPTKQTSAMLKEMGININGIVEGNAGNLKGTVLSFASALDTLAPLQRARAIEQMFGKFQFARLSTLFQNVASSGSQAGRALKLAGASVEELAILSERELGKVEDAVGVKFQASIEKLKQSLMPIGKEFLKAATPIVEFFGNIFDKFNNLSDGTKKVVTIITAALGLIGPVALMTFGLLANGAANVIKFFALLRGGIAKLNGQTGVLGAGFDYLTQNEIENLAQSNALHTSHAKLISVFNVEKSALDSLASSYANASTQARSLASSSPGLFAAPGAKAAVSKLPQTKRYAKGILSVPGPKGAGDVTPAMLSPGESVIPTKQTEKHRELIKAIMTDSVPGHMAGRLPKGPQSSRSSLFLGMPKSFSDTTKRITNQNILNQIDAEVKKSRFAGQKPENFGTLVSPTSGRSFPVPGIGGIYQKGDGSRVFVKPMLDERSALAEMRATQIAREAHDLKSPMQQIKTMLDPTDKSGKRRLFVLESPYDETFAKMNGKFSKKDYFKQLVASALRGDKDLQMGNLSGSVLADVGTAGVFKMASGKRDFETNMPSMAEQARINLLGVKGGAKRFFAESTLSVPKGMTPDAYHAAMIKEIDTVLPKLKKTVSSFNLNKDEKLVYENMIKRLEEGKRVNWREFHAVHSAVTPSAKKELTAAAIAKRFEEQQLKARQRGHANQDFYVSGFENGRFPNLPAGPSQNTQRIKELEKYMDEAVSQPGVSEAAKKKWESKKKLFLKNFEQQIAVTPEGLFDTQRGGKPVTMDHTKQALKYIFGIEPNAKGKMVTGSFGKWEKLKEKMTIGGSSKAAGGLKVNNPKAYAEYQKVLAEDDARNKALGAKGETSSLIEHIKKKYPNVSPGQLDRLVQTEAVHIEPGRSQSGKSIARSEEKWIKGQAFPDLGAINNYMNSKSRAQKILDWDKRSGGALKLTAAQRAEYEKAAQYMASGRHPTNIEEAKLVRSAAELELRAHALLEESTKTGGKAPKGLSATGIKADTKYAADAAKFLVDTRVGKDNTFYADLTKFKKIINLDTKTRTGNISVGKGEGIVRDNKSKPEVVTGQNTKPRPVGSTVKGGPSSERVPNKPGAVVTKQQMRFIGKQEGDFTGIQAGNSLSKNAQGRITYQLQQQEKLLRARNNVSQQDITQALSQYKKRLVFAEQEKARQYTQQQVARQSAKVESELLATRSQMARAARKERVGQFSGKAAGALGGIAMGAAMTGADAKVTGGLFAASTVAGMLPALMNPWVAAATAMAAVGVVAWKFNKNLTDATKEGANVARSMSMTSEKLKDLSEISGTVSASEIANRRRQNMATGTSAVQRKYGMNILGSDFGKGLLSDISKQAETGAGPKEIAKNISNSLGVAITQGVISVDQAKSISSALGEKLKSYEIPALITGDLVNLFGPNGENLAKDPLGVRLEIQEDSMKQQANAFKNAIDFAKPTRTVAGGAQMAAGVGLMGSAGAAAATGVGAPVAAALAVAGAVSMGKALWDQNKAMAANNKLAGAAIQLGIEQVTQNQGLVDSLNREYDDKLKTAKTAKEIATIEKNRKKDLETLNAKNKESLDILIEQKKNLDPKVFADAIKAQTDTMYKEGPMKVFADQANEALSKMSESGFKTTLQLEYASGNLDPITLSNLIKYATGNKALEASYDLIVKDQSGADATLAMQLLSKAGAKPETITTMMEMLAKNPKQFKENIDAINVLSNMQTKYGITVDINVDGDEKIAKVKSITDALKNEKSEITQEIIAKYAKDPKNPNQSVFQGILDNWQTLVGSSKSISKTMTIDFVAAGDKNVVDAYLAEKGISTYGLPRDFIDKTYGKAAAAWDVGTGKGANNPVVPTPGGGGGGGGKRDTTLDDMLRRLKFIADASIDATKGVAELKRITVGDGITKFAGVLQQLMSGKTGGVNQEFLSFIESMDEATRKTYLTISKGKATLTDQGKRLNEAFNEKTIREFSIAQNQSVQQSLAQRAALIKLTNAGVDNATALEMVADGNLAIAITAKDITPKELNELANAAKKAKKEVEDLNLELQNAAETSRKDLADLSKNLDTLQQVKSRYPSITKEQLSAISENPSILRGFAKMFSNTGTQEELAKLKKDLEDWVNNIDLTIKIKVKTEEVIDPIGTKTAEFAETSARFAKYIALARAKVEQQFRGRLESANNAVDPYYQDPKTGAKSAGFIAREAQERLDAVEESINAENTRYERQTKDIEDEYRVRLYNYETLLDSQQKALDEATAKLEAAQKEISDMQEAVRMKYDSLYSDASGTINTASTEFLQRQIDARNEIIKNDIDKPIEGLQEFIDQAERRIELNFTRPIAALEESSAKYADDLALMDHATEAINKKYDLQEEALNKISAINDEIIGQQRQQLDLAGAISSGDIGAAAKAMQEIQTSRVNAMAKTQQERITAARTGEINALTGATSGLTRDEIAEKQWMISRQIYDLQQKQKVEDQIIFDLKEQIYAKEELRKVQMGLLNALESQMTATIKERQTALDAIALKELAIKPLVDAVATAQTAVNATQKAYNDLLAEKDAKLKAAELAHIANLAKYQAELRAAQDELTEANKKLALAEEALAALQREIAAAQAEIDKQAQAFLDLETTILAAETAASDLTAELALATAQATALAAALNAKATATKASAAADAEAAKAAADKAAAEKAAADAKAAASKAAAEKAATDAEDEGGLTKGTLEALKRAEAKAAADAAAAAKAAAEAQAAEAEALRARLAQEAADRLAAEEARIKAEEDRLRRIKEGTSGGYFYRGSATYKASGGLIPKYFATGGYARGTDTVPAMLTPGEFVMSKYAVSTHGIDKLRAINNGDSVGDSVYNYSVSVNVKSDANPDEIARAVMMQIKQVDGQKIRGNRY